MLLKHKAFWSTEPTLLTWDKVQIWSANGSFVIGAKDDTKVYGELPDLATPNLPVLEQIIRSFFKTGGQGLSSLLQ